MQVQDEGCSRVESRLRLLQLMVPSLAVGAVIFAGVANAQSTLQVPTQPNESFGVAPVLKSVGINFRALDSANPKASSPTPEPAKLVAPELTPQNYSVKPDILLPPMVAGAISTPANPESVKTESVKIDLHAKESTQAKSRPTMIVTAKDTEKLPSSVNVIVAPPVLPSQLQGTPSQSVGFQAPPSTPSASVVDKRNQIPTDGQRSAQVVRLPSMKVSNSKITEAAPPALENSAPTPKLAPSLVLNNTPVPPKAIPVATATTQVPTDYSIASKEDSFQVHLKDGEQSPAETTSRHSSQSQSKFVAEHVTLKIDDAAKNAGKDFQNLPAVVALPVSRVHSVPSLDTTDEIGNASSKVAKRKSSSASSTGSMSKQSLPKKIDILYRNVQTVDVGRPIARIDIQDDTVCKALTTDGTSVILIGLAHGQTTINVWPIAAAGEEATPESYSVSVDNAWKSDANDNRSLNSVEAVQETLSEMFPTANITLKSASNGSLVVIGKAESNEQAKKIAQLVRKTFLVPVVDRIAVASP